MRRLGAGGMGVVFEAEDLETGARVALKSLDNVEPETIYRLKREFRALAGITHPNLAQLYDLWIDDEQCFYTMELVRGVDFTAYCAGAHTAGHLPGEEDTLEVPVSPIACDERRLRAALRQLASGVAALHDAGKIHRDLKPSNVIVELGGRVVILDFGLVTEVGRRSKQSMVGQIVGTVEYMAPEQAGADAPLSPAADWYSVGAMVYEAITGRLPFVGTPVEMLREKIRHAPPPPRAIIGAVPEDLDELCVELLARDPQRRPLGAEVLRRVGAGRHATAPGSSAQARVTEHAAFAGRIRELEQLELALGHAEAGRCAVVRLTGPSGIGKTELARAFFDRAEARRSSLLVLEGRCFRGEAVPYKAIDALIDHLSRVWSSLPAAEAASIVPRWGGLLQTLFPVLGRVPALVQARNRKAPADAQERRARAFGALREVLARLADRHPLVLFIDDMQWVDADTVTLLIDLLQPPDPPPLLLILASRESPEEASAAARLGSSIPGYPQFDPSEAREDRDRGPIATLVRELRPAMKTIEVGPLGGAEAVELASRLLGHHADRYAARVAREAGGNPFFLGELAQYVKAVEPGDAEEVGLHEAVGHRIGRLNDESRRLLEVVCVAGEALSRRVAGTASGLEGAELTRELRLLAAAQLVRAAHGDENRVESYHNRFREAVLAGLAPRARADHHRAIAIAYERWNEGTPDQRARHWFGAGDAERAGQFARRAAESALAALDFDRAARFFQMVLAVGGLGPDEERSVLVDLAEAQKNAGRPLDAANAFLAAAKSGDVVQRRELRRRAAQALLGGGYQAQGLAVVREVLAEIGMSLPETPRRALASLLWQRAMLRLRGLGFTARDETQVAPDLLAKIDVCWSVGQGLVVVDNIRGADFQARHLRLALRTGEPLRIARAFAYEAILLATQASTRAVRLLELARRTLPEGESAGRLEVAAMVEAAAGAYAYFATNRWRDGRDRFGDAARMLHAGQAYTGWEAGTSVLYECFCRAYLGELSVLEKLVAARVRDATNRGDLYTSVNFRTRLSVVQLAADQPEQAAADVDAALASWAGADSGFQVQHWFAMHDAVSAALYRGDAAAAQRRLDADYRGLERSQLLRVKLVRAEAEYLRARAALVAGDTRAARAAARRIAATHRPVAGAWAVLVRACAARIDGDRAGAMELMRAAVGELADLETGLMLHPARYQLGRGLGGTEGDGLAAEADEWMREQGVVDPARFAALYAPGW